MRRRLRLVLCLFGFALAGAILVAITTRGSGLSLVHGVFYGVQLGLIIGWAFGSG
jgi:hypothetical protein